MTRRRGGRILPAMVALLLALLGVACASAATLAWRLVVFHERLRALEVGQAATSARVLALAPAQVDASSALAAALPRGRRLALDPRADLALLERAPPRDRCGRRWRRSLDSSRREERGGWLADGAGWGAAEARAEAALLEVLLALPA